MLLFYNSNEEDFSHIHLYLTYIDPHSAHFPAFLFNSFLFNSYIMDVFMHAGV